MQKTMFLAKIHRAIVTHADVEYEGSVTIDETLMEAAGIVEHEAVHIWNIDRGSRLMTYALKGPRDSGTVCVNGAAAHLNAPGEKVILATFGQMSAEQAREHQPVIIHVDEKNRIVSRKAERPGPSRPEAIH